MTIECEESAVCFMSNQLLQLCTTKSIRNRPYMCVIIEIQVHQRARLSWKPSDEQLGKLMNGASCTGGPLFVAWAVPFILLFDKVRSHLRSKHLFSFQMTFLIQKITKQDKETIVKRVKEVDESDKRRFVGRPTWCLGMKWTRWQT